MNRILGLYHLNGGMQNLNGGLMNPIEAILLPFAGVKNPSLGMEIRSPGLFGVRLEVAPRIDSNAVVKQIIFVSANPCIPCAYCNFFEYLHRENTEH